MATINYQLIGNKVRQARLNLHLSQEKLAEACDISASYLGHIERGTRKMSLETFSTICNMLQLTPSYLLFSEPNDSCNNIFTFDLDSLNTTDPRKKENFINAIQALAVGVDKL